MALRMRPMPGDVWCHRDQSVLDEQGHIETLKMTSSFPVTEHSKNFVEFCHNKNNLLMTSSFCPKPNQLSLLSYLLRIRLDAYIIIIINQKVKCGF